MIRHMMWLMEHLHGDNVIIHRRVVMETSNSSLRLMSGEPGCSREVRMLGIGGGGSSALSRAGGGSGYVEFNDSVVVVANRDIGIIVGEGGLLITKGEDTTISYSQEF